MRKTALVPVVAAIAALPAVPASSAIASGGGTTLHLVATQTSGVNQPHGFSFTEVLRNTNGKKVEDVPTAVGLEWRLRVMLGGGWDSFGLDALGVSGEGGDEQRHVLVTLDPAG